MDHVQRNEARTEGMQNPGYSEPSFVDALASARGTCSRARSWSAAKGTPCCNRPNHNSVSVAEQVGPVRVAQSIATLIETSKVLPAAEKHDVSHSGLLAHIPLSCSCLSRLASL